MPPAYGQRPTVNGPVTVLDATQRAAVRTFFMQNKGGPDGVNKTELAAVVAAIDDWVEANTTSYNTAIPQPQRGNMSALHKSLVLCYVVMKRQGIL